MLATIPLRRTLTYVAGIALLVASMHAPPTFAAAPVTIIGVVDNTDAIASCSLRIDPDAKTVTPLVTMQPPPRASAVDVRFTFFTSSGTPIGTQDVSVPPPSFGPALAPFPLPGSIASAHCDLKPPDTSSSAPNAGASGGGGAGGGAGLAIVGGIVAVGAIVAVAAGHGGGGGSPSSSPITAPPTTAPPTTPTPVHPTASPTPVRTPTSAPTATPITTASPVPTSTPVPTATPPGPTPSPSLVPTATPVSGPIVLTPSSLSFTSTGSAYNQSSTASEANYTGTFSAAPATCSGGFATISISGATFTVTPQAAGTCAFTISDTHGNSTQLPVTVTVSSGTIEGHRKSVPLPKPHS